MSLPRSAALTRPRPIPLNAIKVDRDLFIADVDNTAYCLVFSSRTLSYDLYEVCSSGEYLYRLCAIVLEEVKEVWSPWPNALLFDVKLRDGKSVTIEVERKTEAEALVSHLLAVIGLEEAYGMERFQRGRRLDTLSMF